MVQYNCNKDKEKEVIKMTDKELIEMLKNNIEEYASVDEYCEFNNIDKEDFNEWLAEGHSEDGFVEIMSNIAAGNATTGEYAPITNYNQVFTLVKEEIQDSNFNDIIEMLNDDNPDDQIDPNDMEQVLQAFVEYATIAIVKTEKGLILVIDYD